MGWGSGTPSAGGGHWWLALQLTGVNVVLRPLRYVDLFSEHFGYEQITTSRKHKLGSPLLISGVTGSGKSTIASALVEWAKGD